MSSTTPIINNGNNDSNIKNEMNKDVTDMVKKAKKKHDKTSEKYFLIIIAFFISCIYYIYTFEFIWVNLTGK